jgi:hypothetical protein
VAEYDFQSEVLTRLARIEASQEMWREARDREIKEAKGCLADHETRLRPLESQHNKVLGVAAVSGIVTAIIIKIASMLWGGGVR